MTFPKYVLAAAMLTLAASAHADPTLINEGFDDITTLAGAGWSFQNDSVPATPGESWFQGDNTLAFTAQSGAANSYIASSFLAAEPGGFIDNLLVTPFFSLESDVLLTFWARSQIVPGFTDTFAVLAGTTAGSALEVVSEVLGATVAAGDWTQYSVLLTGQGAGSVGRFGFEYFGPSDSSNYLGIDTVTVTAVPEPGTYLLMGLGLAALGALRSRKAARESTL